MRLTIFTHVEHKIQGCSYIAYAPYVREMNIWIDKFDNVEIVAPIVDSEFNHVTSSYIHSKILFTKVSSFSLLSFKSFIKAVLKMPFIFYTIFKAMKSSDHIHLRTPGNIGLVACLVQIFFPSKKKTAKYAGNWDPNSKQPWSYNLQKWILKNQLLTQNCKVLVYGDWSQENPNILSFFTASFKEKEYDETFKKVFDVPYKFIFVGSLVEGKRPNFAISIVEELNRRGFPSILTLYGDGYLKDQLFEESKDKEFVEINGSVSLDKLVDFYKKSQFLILPSRSEGWPKAVAEAMFFGCIPIATAVSCVPYMLDYGKRGVIIESELDQAVLKVMQYLKNESELYNISRRATFWSREYTLEKFEKEIASLI